MPEQPSPQANRTRAPEIGQMIRLLALAAVVGVVASIASWSFLELIHIAQDGVYEELPDALGFAERPLWWPLPGLALGGLLCALAITRLPGNGGHIPVHGVDASPTMPIELPGVLLAAAASIAFGAVVGPEAPLIALGGGLGLFMIRRLNSDAEPEVSTLIAACGTFAAVSFLFGSPLIAAVLLAEALGAGGRKLRMVIVPGLLAAGIGSLVSIGLGDWTGVDSSDISLELLSLEEFARPDVVDFLWTIPLAAAIAVGIVFFLRAGTAIHATVAPRPFVLPFVGLAIGGLAIAFAELAGKSFDFVLFSGQTGMGTLVDDADTWSATALALVIGFKGLAYSLSVASFRGGAVFPALFLGAAAGLLAADLPGFELSPAVAVGLGAATVAVLRLPLSSVVFAMLLTSQAGVGAGPLVILGVVVAYFVAMRLDPKPIPGDEPAPA